MEELAFISCVRFSMQLMIAESVFVSEFPKRNRFIWRMLGSLIGYFLLAYVVFTAFQRIPGNIPLVYTAYYTSLFFLSLGVIKCCFVTRGKDILFAGVCGYATQHIAFALVMIVQELTGISFGVVLDFIVIRFLPYLAVSLFIHLVVIRRSTGKRELKDLDIRMIFLAFVILLTTVFVSVMVDSKYFVTDSSLMRNVICKIYAVICCSLAIFVAFGISKQNRVIHENEMMEAMLHNMKEQQRLSRENINIINIKCHDLKYRISRISRIEESKDQEEYIDSIKDALAIYDNIYQTGNDVLDLVLTEKGLLCDEYGIKMTCMIDALILGFMSVSDMNALFGNLIDNAVESTMKEEKERRFISIQVKKRGQGCHIHIDNTCSVPPSFKDGLPVTTKKDKAYHGFGVRSVKYIVDKYKGDLLMQAVEGRFSVDILFYQ